MQPDCTFNSHWIVIMNINYSDIVKTPDAHLEFLRTLKNMTAQAGPGVSLHAIMASNITVGDKEKFSQSKHLFELEKASYIWDLPLNQIEDKSALHDVKKVEMIKLTQELMSKDQGYDLAHFTSGFDKMAEDIIERKVQMAAAQKPSPSPSDFSSILSTLRNSKQHSLNAKPKA